MIRQLTQPTQITPTEEKIYLEIDNGDLQAIKSIKSKYKFINFEALIRFAFVVLLSAQNNNIYVDESDKKVKISPSPEVLDPVKGD